MKKILLLFLSVVISAVVMADNNKLVKNSSSNFKAIKSSMAFPANHLLTKTRGLAVALKSDNSGKIMQAPQAGLSYSKPTGTYHGGPLYDASQRGPAAYGSVIVGKANYDWTFVAAGGSNYSWSIVPPSGSPIQLPADANGNGIYNVPTGAILLPTVTSGTNSYFWHQELGAGNQWASVSNQLIPISMVDVWKDTKGDGWGYDLGIFSDYGYGTGPDTQTGAPVGCVQIYDKPQAPLYIESVNISVFSNSNKPLPNGSTMSCYICPINSNGAVDLSDPIATAACTANDLENWGNISSNIVWFNAPFHFYAVDPVSGFYSPMDLVVSDVFAIVLTWTDGADFGCLWNKSDAAKGQSFVFDDSGAGYSYSASNDKGATSYAVDLLFNINGVMPELRLDPDLQSVTFDPAGGASQATYTGEQQGTYSNVILESTFSADAGDVTIDTMPDWAIISSLTDEVDPDYGFTNYVDATFYADPLPAGVAGRSADIVARAHSFTTTIHITQGDVAGIPAVKVQPVTVSLNGDNFVLKYPASAASVSVYNVAGQKLAEYKLPATESFIIPAGNYFKGVYFFNFAGANGSTTVKIMK